MERRELSFGIALEPGRNSRCVRSGERARRLAGIHQLQKLGEEIVAIMRSRARFRVVLDREGGQGAVAKSLDRAVIQVEVGELQVGIVEEVGQDSEAVVLR